MLQGRRGSRDPVATAAMTRSGRTMIVSSGLAVSAGKQPAPPLSSRRTSAQVPAVCGSGAAAGAEPPAVAGALILTRRRPCRRHRSTRPGSGWRAVSTAGRPRKSASSRTGVPSPAGTRSPAGMPATIDTGGLAIRPPGRTVAGVRDLRSRGRCCRAPVFSRGVAVDAMTSRTRSLRMAAARAILRTAAARSWPPVIAQPIRIAFLIMALAWGRRSVS